jgi:hypothetical protein
MAAVFISLPTFEELRQHVLETLCKHDHLDPEQTPLFQGLVTRAGRPCELFFHVQGPRQVRNYALWVGDENRILFYDGAGQRFAESRLSDGPDPLQAAA